MNNKQKYFKFPIELIYIVILFSVLFLMSFWWKMHRISVQLQNEYEMLKEIDRETFTENVSRTPLVSTQISLSTVKTIHIATSVCSSSSKRNSTKSRENAAILLKSIIISALLYNVPKLTFHLFLLNYEHDSNYFANLKFIKHLDKNMLNVKTFSYSVEETIPQEYQQNIPDKSLYCLYTRLFMASVLEYVDAVVYLDNSMIMIDNISMFWDQFNGMHSYELLGVATVPEPYATRDLKNMKAHTKGMDSNLLFMNLTRMRKNHWQDNFLHLYQQGSRQLGYFITDQELVDTLLYYATDSVMPVTCQFNFILSKESCCVNAEKDTFGIRAIRPDFNSSSSLKAFRLIYDLVKSTKVKTYKNLTYFQDFYMIPLRQLVASALGNRTKVPTRKTTMKTSDSNKKSKCELPIYTLLFRQFFG